MDQLAIEQDNTDIILSELNQGERKIMNNIVKKKINSGINCTKETIRNANS